MGVKKVNTCLVRKHNHLNFTLLSIITAKIFSLIYLRNNQNNLSVILQYLNLRSTELRVRLRRARGVVGLNAHACCALSDRLK